MQYFWYTYHDLPDGVGFSYFGVKHLTALGVIVVCIILCSLLFRRLTETGQDRMLKIIAVLTAGGEVIKDSFLLYVGHMSMEYLPLHLCSFAIIVFLAHAFMKESRLKNALGEISWCLLLPGSICALLFPNWKAYPMFTFMNLHSFYWHALLVLYPILLLISGRIRPTLKHWWYPVVFLLIVVPPVYLFDVKTGYNYMFVNVPMAGTPLETLYDVLGPWWRVGYAAAALVVILFMLAAAQLYGRKSTRSSS